MEYKCAMRNTRSICKGEPYKIDDPEDPDHGREVTDQLSYQSFEMPTVWWNSRPMRQWMYAFVLEIWLTAWPVCTEISRRQPPTNIQSLAHAKVIGSGMNKHCDNRILQSVRNLKAGNDPFTEGDREYMGCPNSQLDGSNVYIFTVGNEPMRMTLSYINPGRSPDQSTKQYIEINVYSMELCDGYLTVLDPIDDLCAVHAIKFPRLELESMVERGPNGEEIIVDFAHRFGIVIRHMTNWMTYYTDTSTIKLTDAMKAANERSTANNSMEGGLGGRSAFS